jgi:hypothetical protein
MDKVSKKKKKNLIYKQISLHSTAFNTHAPFVLFEKAY